MIYNLLCLTIEQFFDQKKKKSCV